MERFRAMERVGVSSLRFKVQEGKPHFSRFEDGSFPGGRNSPT